MPLALLAVHAHPDDETILTGGVLARYAAEGITTAVVTCTGGEAGEISDPALATPATLGAVRARELAEVLRILGVHEHIALGYRDSGMMGTPDNDHPDAFWRADLEAATHRLVAVVRRLQPDVIVCDDERGGYGHPDHLNGHHITVAAFHAAGDPARYPTPGLGPWAPRKLYYPVWPRSRMRRLRELLAAQGITDLFGDGDDAEAEEWSVPDDQVTAVVDIGPFVARKRAALAAHRTQMGPDSFFMRLPESAWKLVWNVECFRLAAGPGGAVREDDLFAGLR
jgi:N-acetyl-1-D-myo-inositol-2-amino-2-deoxy-alpha-D-glucopyranoside deacetylase